MIDSRRHRALLLVRVRARLPGITERIDDGIRINKGSVFLTIDTGVAIPRD